MQVVENLLRVIGQVDQAAALDRLHDQYRLVVLTADLIAFAALDGNVIVVQVVELDLHDLNLRVLGQDLVQHRGAGVERDAHMAHLALGFQLERRLVGAAVLEMLVVGRPLGVHEVEVKVIDTAGLELALEEGTDIRLRLEVALAQLIGQDVVFPIMAAGQALFQGQLAFALDVAVGCVKVVEPLRQKGIDHLLGLFNVDVLALHRQAHTAEPEIFLDFFHL